MNNDTLSLKKTTDTRWGSHYNSIIAIYRSYDETIRIFDKLYDDNDKLTEVEANAIRDKLVSYEYFCILLFMKDLMSMTNVLITTLQGEDPNILLAIDTLRKKTPIYLLHKMRNDKDSINNLLELDRQRVLNYDVDGDVEFDKTSTSFKITVRYLALHIGRSDLTLDSSCLTTFKHSKADQISLTQDLSWIEQFYFVYEL